jgi:hypothetical protein
MPYLGKLTPIENHLKMGFEKPFNPLKSTGVVESRQSHIH